MRVLSLVLTAALLALAPAPAHADPVPVEQRMVVYGASILPPEGYRFLGVDSMFLSYVGPSSVEGVTVRVRTTSCGLPITDRTEALVPGREALVVVFDESGQPFGSETLANAVNRNIGRSLDYTVTVTHPGQDPYDLSGSVEVGSEMATCGKIAADVNDPQWGKRIGKARVGARYLSVDLDEDPRFRHTYTWKVGGKVVRTGVLEDLGDFLPRVKRSWRGKKLTVTVVVDDFGSDVVSKTYRFGRIR